MHTKKDTFSTFFRSFQYFDLVDLIKLFGSRLSNKNSEIESLVNIADKSSDFLLQSHSYLLITDIKTMRFLYVSPTIEKVTEYNQEEFINGGVSFFIKQYCPADRENGMKMLNKIVSHQKQEDIFDKQYYQYITTFRFMKKSGYYAFMYNRMMFLKHDQQNNPQILVSLVSNIESFIRNDNLFFARLKFNNKTFNFKTEFLETYIPEYLNILSDKDLEILELLSEGLSNKQIAAKLKHTEQTIKDYRKKMLKKTWCDNTAELLTFALRNGLLEN